MYETTRCDAWTCWGLIVGVVLAFDILAIAGNGWSLSTAIGDASARWPVFRWSNRAAWCLLAWHLGWPDSLLWCWDKLTACCDRGAEWVAILFRIT